MNREADPGVLEMPAGPVASDRRIGALDLARGFALLGILLVNIQTFNLSMLDPAGGKRALPTDGIVQWVLATFFENKFWALFSILFGMGFAVMMEGAESDRRGFVARYLRRALALAAFGALHIVLIWHGDILFNYAVTALVLLAILFCGPWLGMALAGMAILCAQPLGLATADAILLCLFAAMTAVYLRAEGPRRRIALASGGLASAAILGAIAIYAASSPGQAHKYAGYALVFLAACAMTLFERRTGAGRFLRAGIVWFLATMLASAIALSLPKWTPAGWWPPTTAATEVQKVQRRIDLRARGMAQNAAMAQDSYIESVRFRAESGFKRPLETLFVMTLAAGALFLIGIWLVRSGAARWPDRHARLWRGLAWVGFPLGVAAVIGGDKLAELASASKPAAAWLSILPEAGAAAMALGYLAFAFLLTARGAAAGRLSWISATGRMALTNYLMQSLIATWFFHGYGLAFWGLGRTWQALFCVTLFALQAAFSAWWLSGHRYGPMEWLWRWITYARKPELRVRA